MKTGLGEKRTICIFWQRRDKVFGNKTLGKIQKEKKKDRVNSGFRLAFQWCMWRQGAWSSGVRTQVVSHSIAEALRIECRTNTEKCPLPSDKPTARPGVPA